jgi:hypothetical protein
MNDTANPTLFKFSNENENFKIKNPSADAKKVPSHKAESSKLTDNVPVPVW